MIERRLGGGDDRAVPVNPSQCPLIGLMIACVGAILPLIGMLFPNIGRFLTLVGQLLPLVRQPLAFRIGRFPLGGLLGQLQISLLSLSSLNLEPE